MSVKNRKICIGIDEAGRGPIAGPVSVCSFVMLDLGARKVLRGARDSKKLSEKQREEWFSRIKEAKKNKKSVIKVHDKPDPKPQAQPKPHFHSYFCD